MPKGLVGRPQAATLALDLAKEARGRVAEGFHFSGEPSRNIFAALLYAAPEFPDEVSEIALELSARREEPKHAIERAIAAEKERDRQRQEYLRKHPEARKRTKSFPGVSSFHLPGEMRRPAADGPTRRVEEAFQSAVLDTTALNSLVSVRPAAAREVLLACCIDEPGEIERGGPPILADLGLTHWRNRMLDLYSKGPFLSFLQASPLEGLEAIIRLVNYATDRWLEEAAGPAASAEDRKKYGLEFPLNDKDVLFLIGNCNVFSWSRYGDTDLDLIVCALMALEKWLYDELEKGNSIDETIKLILAGARSLAFAGVLVSVGLKQQSLFADILRPFLGNMLLYDCQWELATSEFQNLWKIQLNYRGNLDPRLVKMLADWHTMPHRQLRLRDVARWIMMQHKPTFEFITARRQLFLSSLTTPEAMDRSMKALMICFDPANYHETILPDGQIQTEFRVPEDFQQETRESQRKAELEAMTFTIPSESRQYLSKGKQLMPEEAAEFLSKLQRLEEHASEIPDDSKHRIDDALAGGIAVLATQHLPWLIRNPKWKTWCLKTLERLSSNSRPVGYSPNDLLDISAETFLGEAAIALLTESDEEFLRVAVFNAITGFYYNSTSHTIWAAYRLRSKLGDRFEVFLNVMTHWAALRRAANRESMYTGQGDWLEKYRGALRKRFLKGSIPTTFVSLERIELLGKRLLNRINRKEERRWGRPVGRTFGRDDKIDRDPPPLDTEVLQKGFTFLGEMADSTSLQEIREFTSYVRALFEMEMRSLPKVDPDSSGNRELEGHPYEYEHWIWQLTALAITRTESTELQREFWQPILDLGATAHYWVRDFFRAWFNVGLPCCGDPLDRFASVWRQMADYTFESKAWTPEGKRFWFHLDDLAVDLMGLRDSNSLFGDSIGALLRESRYRQLIVEMKSTFEQWTERWLRQEGAAIWFAHFLPSDSGLALITMGIKKIGAVIGDLPKRDWDRGDLGYSLAMALRACWTHNKSDLQSDTELNAAFKAMLSELVGRMEPLALQLQVEIAGGFSSV
jgi:hypothetical protein